MKLLGALFILLLVTVSLLMFQRHERLTIDGDTIGSNDFHITAPGTFADDGSFTDDMQNYLQGQGPI